VVITSVHAEQNRAGQLGASDYLVKPIDRAPLLESIARLRQVDSKGAAAPEDRPARPDAPTMLVVDDHDVNRELIRTLLERKGYRVLLAGTGEAGIEIARRERPSLILLDLAMPGSDGFATARELRADDAFDATPLVAVTAMAMRGDEERAKEAGFDAYVTKPVDRRELEDTVARLLKRSA
jgi:CheY-like chemotaxis protein